MAIGSSPRLRIPNGKVSSVRLRIVCVKPPNPQDHRAKFGLEEKGQKIHPGRVHADGSNVFECELQVQPNRRTKEPNFVGPYAFGSPGERFLYLSWNHIQPDGSVYMRKMKIHLSSITWDQIQEASESAGVLEVAVPGTASDGGLRCGSVAFLGEGWSVRPA